jgi:hypothetical protein
MYEEIKDIDFYSFRQPSMSLICYIIKKDPNQILYSTL